MADLLQLLAKLSPEQRLLFERRLKERGLTLGQSLTIPKRPDTEDIPLSFAQQRLWFIQQLEPTSSVYNVPCVLRLRGVLQVSALEKSLNELRRRHETLRTCFTTNAQKQPIQVITPWEPLALPIIDISEINTPLEVEMLALAEAKRPFDLSQPLLRSLLLYLGEKEYILLLTTHHIISDRWSIGVFLKELSLLYSAFIQEETSSLPELPIQYADWAVWQRQQLQGEFLTEQISYWQQQLGGELPVLQLSSRPQPAVPTYSGSHYPVALSPSLSQAVKALAAKQGVTLFMLLLTSFQVLLYRYTGKDDLVIGTDIVNRDRQETENLIGLLVNTLVLRTNLAGNPTVQELLARVREVALAAFAHQYLPFEKLVEVLNPERNLSQMMPLFQVKFDLQLASVRSPQLPGLTLERLPFDEDTAKYELRLNLQDTEQGITGQFEYSTDLFDVATIARMAEHWITLLKSIVVNTEQRLSEISFLTGNEQQQFQIWNQTTQEYPSHQCLHQLFEAQVERTPDEIALIFGEQSFTYRELNSKANQLAHHLQHLGVKVETPVGICLERSVEMVVGILGILKAGGVYVPLDPGYPESRLRWILDDARVPILLSHAQTHRQGSALGSQRGLLPRGDALAHSAALASLLPRGDAKSERASGGFPHERLASGFADLKRLPRTEEIERVIYLDEDWEAIAENSVSNPVTNLTPENLAYLIYTSGSTGKPKGVMIEHRNPVCLLYWAREVFSADAIAGVLASTSICFDLSIFELFVPLSWGGKVILAENALALSNLPAKNQVTLINTVPSAIAQLLQLNAIPNSVQTVNLAGEPLSWRLVQKLEELPHIQQIFNLYGPSEDTTYSTYVQLKGVTPITPSPTIGQPIANSQVYVLDENLQPVPVGVSGELYIGGAGVARGYWQRPDLTAERFIPNLFYNSKFKIQNSKLYKTGDRVRYLQDGNLEYLGRLDNQVKIRGYRIELGEIEAVLSQHSDVQECAVIAPEEVTGDKRLVAYIAPISAKSSKLRQFLAERLPGYMIPTNFITLEALPRTPNGKIDRQALPTGEKIRPELENAYVEARTPTEQTLVIIWEETLQVEQIGVNDNFFVLGGHSLLGIQLVAKINESLNVEVPLKSLFQHPTIAALAAQIEQLQGDITQSGLPQIQPRPQERYQPFPLTDIQQAYLIGRNAAFELGNVATHGYQEVETVGLSVEQMEWALQKLIEHHDMLRVIVQPDGQQRVLKEVPPYKIAVTDLRGELEPLPNPPLSKGREQLQNPPLDKGRVPDRAGGVELMELRDRLSHQIFATSCYPLFEIQAVLLDKEKIRFCISFDVLIGDAWSFRLLGTQLVQILHNPDTQLPASRLSFRDYVLAEQELRKSAIYARSQAYWKARLATLPAAPDLPLTQPLSTITQPHFVRRSGNLAPEKWHRLKQQASQVGITPSGLLLSAFAEILSRWSKEPCFTLNLTLFNRLPLHPDVNRIVGDFTASLLLAIENKGRKNFLELARHIQAQLWEDLDHRYVSGVEVLRHLARNQQRVTGAIMPVVFTSTLTQDNREQTTERSWHSELVYSLSQTSQVYFDHQVGEVAGALVFNWDTIDDLFPPGLLDEMFHTYSEFLEHLATSSAGEMREKDFFPMPNDATCFSCRRRYANKSAEPQGAVAPPCPMPHSSFLIPLLHTLFFEQVTKQPNQPAIFITQKSLTYQQVSDRVCHLAQLLQQLGVIPNQLVAIVMDKGWEQVIAALAILTAGAAYVPIDPQLPTQRRLHLLQSTQAQIILTQSWLDVALEWVDDCSRICVDTFDAPPHTAIPAPIQQPTDLAYVIYTSGSTGKPKGVMIDHQGAVNTILDINQRFGMTASDRILALSSLSFDLSVYDIFGILAAGGAIVIPDCDRPKDPSHWMHLITQHQVTIWNSVPALMQLLVEWGSGEWGVGSGDEGDKGDEEDLFPMTPLASPVGDATRTSREARPTQWLPNAQCPMPNAQSLRLILLSGDWIPLTLPERICSQFNHPQIISLGGATEASIWSIFYPITKIDPTWKSIPYGYSLTNQQVYVLNQSLQPCPNWVIGELYIGGLGIAKGYWQNPELTAERFIPNPFIGDWRLEKKLLSREAEVWRIPMSNANAPCPLPPAPCPLPNTLYKTGDLGRYLPDGTIEFLGREDFQVKINGYRIELGEIEAALQQHPAIAQAVVTTLGLPSQQQLLAYVVLQPEVISTQETALNSSSQLDFKLQQRGVRGFDSTRSVALPGAESSAVKLQRQSYRQFLEQSVSLNSLGEFLECLRSQQLLNSPLPKYRYASAGSLYPVQTYIYIKPNRVQNLAAGIYYYHPQQHQLIHLSNSAKVDSGIYGINQGIFDQAAFALFLIGEMQAIAPIYGDKSRDFCLLEAGYISQLLMETAPDYDLGLCPIGALEFDVIRENFALHEEHILLHSFVGGCIDPTWKTRWLSPENPQTQLTKTELMTQKLRQFLQQRLPEYMIPTLYMPLEALPLTPNGKVDRRALPLPEFQSTKTDSPVILPTTDLEVAIANLWQSVLQVEVPSIHDNFFELGGNSLSATQVLAQMRSSLQLDLPIREFFLNPTLASQADLLELQWQKKPQPAKTPQIERVERAQAQQLLANLDQLSEEEVEKLLKQMQAQEGVKIIRNS
ncbi:amino acid adenylation domain-containing protein [Nostoc sp. CHAB 5784]|uniref:non-ribosomal peptide synthetase n=1 Tax=Nostoc mirabile TaxID=2907820 RepID=UPI001E3CC7D3|nr:non-ribosomal peptide synthetase [Nostoc mirabile]MCC5667070.1 amino acid adenylation domain-containing protein [Nostoc mirabile CHAB5784]